LDTLRDILSEEPIRLAFSVFATMVFYVHIVALMRISGKRSLADMTTFDFVTNVSLGSILPAAIVTRGIAFWTGLAVMTTLVALQWLVTWLASRSDAFQSLVANPPRLLYFDGNLQHRNLRRERISEQQLHSKIRERGYASLEELDAVILETSGVFALLPRGTRNAPLVAEVRPSTE